MSRVLSINGESYQLKFSTEAAFYSECLTSLTSLFANIGMAESQNDIKLMMSGLAGIPQTSLTMFYAGLMQNHGMSKKADKKVPNKEAAKELLVDYISEHEDDETGSFAGILAMCFEVMEEDGFLRMIGLDGLMGDKNTEDKSEFSDPKTKKKLKKKNLEVIE